MKNIRFFKQFVFVSLLGLLIPFMASCGSSKNMQDQNETSVPGRTRRTVDPTYKLAAQETDKLRAAQSATSYLEDIALENAEAAAVTALASRLESAITGVRERFNRTSQINEKTMTKQDINNEIKTFISQRVQYKVIGEPSIYDNADKSITVYVCVELCEKTEKILEEAYDALTRDEIISIEYDKKKFIEDNKKELERLKNNVGL